MAKKTSKGLTYEQTLAKAKKRKIYLEKIGYTSIKITKTPKKILAIMPKEKYELSYTIHW